MDCHWRYLTRGEDQLVPSIIWLLFPSHCTLTCWPSCLKTAILLHFITCVTGLSQHHLLSVETILPTRSPSFYPCPTPIQSNLNIAARNSLLKLVRTCITFHLRVKAQILQSLSSLVCHPTPTPTPLFLNDPIAHYFPPPTLLVLQPLYLPASLPH